MQMFQKIQMASEDVKSYLHTGVFYNEDDPAEVFDGAVVVVGELLDHDMYANTKDFNKHKLTAPAAKTDTVGIVDYVGVPTADVRGVQYRVGEKLFGLAPEVGENVRVRDLKPFDKFYLCEDNFASTPTVGQFAEVTANSCVWTPVAAQTAGVTTIRIEGKKNLITGQVNGGTQYLCVVVPNT